MAIKFKAAFEGLGRLKKAIAQAERRTRQAARTAVSDTSRKTQLAIRRDVNAIFSGGSFRTKRSKGRRIGNAVRRKMFDNRERGSAALIYSKFGRKAGGHFVDYLAPYLAGQPIRPRRSRFLAIPLLPGKKNRTPANFPNLVPVQTGGRLFLVRHTRTRSTFMFLLVPRIQIRKRLRAGLRARQEFAKIDDRARRAFR